MKALIVLFLLQSLKPPACIGNLATPGCKSFSEMVSRKDEDLMAKIKPPVAAYICFTPKSDEFTAVSFSPPEDSDFQQDEKNKYVSKAPGFAEIATYLDGVENYSTTFFGQWTAYGKDFKQSTFNAELEKPEGKASAPATAIQITTSEVDVSFSYTNNSKELVTT